MNPEYKLKAIIVDDEDLAREGLRLLLLEIDEVEVIALSSNGLDAVKEINRLKPDVVFLDIQMPHIDGFDVVELLGTETPEIIFVTAYDEYAIKAFEANALDYLLKPVNPSRLKKTISKLNSKLGPALPSLENVITQKKEKNTNIERILVRDGGDVHIIPVENIFWIEAQDDYVAIKTANDVFLKLERLGQLEQQLNAKKFKRIHRSYLLNIDCLVRIENQRFAILKDGSKLPVSRSGYSRLIAE